MFHTVNVSNKQVWSCSHVAHSLLKGRLKTNAMEPHVLDIHWDGSRFHNILFGHKDGWINENK
jgi:hypothetical protein